MKYLVKLFIDLGRKRYSQSCASSRAGEPFKRKTSPLRQSLLIHITYPATHAVSGRYESEGEGLGKHPHLLLDHAEIRGAHACTVTDHRNVSPPDNPPYVTQSPSSVR